MSETVTSPEPFRIYCPQCRQKLDAGDLPAFTLVNCPVCNAEFPVPQPFDGYLLESIIGRGGMATVYRALDTALERTVAVKILNDDLGEELNQKFLAEAKMAALVAHPAVVSIYTCAIYKGTPYIVMEYMDGTTLEKLLQEKSSGLDILQVCAWISNLAGGLERAEKCGIVHHDIKPANMLLNRDGQVKLGDFGIAGTLEQGAARKGERIWGSPNYISPEKALSGVEDQTGDIYSLGATFYHLLTGQVPFPNTGSIQELLRCRVNRDPVPPHMIRSDISPELSLFVLKMMHRVSGMRPSYHQIRLFLLDHVRKNSLKSARGVSGGAAFIPERIQSESAGAGKGSFTKGSGNSSSESKKESASSLPENTGDESTLLARKWRFFTILGKFVLFTILFILIFLAARFVTGCRSGEEIPAGKTFVPEGKK